MKAILTLAVSSVHTESQLPWGRKITKVLPTLDELFANVIMLNQPESAVIGEKVVLQWTLSVRLKHNFIHAYTALSVFVGVAPFGQ